MSAQKGMSPAVRALIFNSHGHIRYSRVELTYKQNFSGTIDYDGKKISSDSIKISKSYLILKGKNDSIDLFDKKVENISLLDGLKNIEIKKLPRQGDKKLGLKLFELNGLLIYNDNLDINIDKTKEQLLLFFYSGKYKSRYFYINGKDNKLISHFLSKRFGMKDDIIAAVLQKLNNL